MEDVSLTTDIVRRTNKRERDRDRGMRLGVFTCSGCRGAWPPSPPAGVCSFRARRPGRLEGGRGHGQ